MIRLELITPGNASTFKAVRLHALSESPTAFYSTHVAESRLSDADWLARAAQCSDDKCVGYLAMDVDTACGIVRATPDDHEPGVAWVESMWVAPSHRRRCVGRLLIGEILAWARNQGIGTLKLEVTGNNEPAIRFYRSLGFFPTGKTRPSPSDPALIECEMSRRL
jgi:ribosomal protein S18 acetylase RimI-like enzyme